MVIVRGPSRLDVALFTRQLATLIQSGLPVHQSLDALVRQNAATPLGLPLLSVRRGLDMGRTLSAALQREATVFSPVYVAMVATGEALGQLDKSLSHLASLLERDAEIRRRVQGALAYPAFVLAVTIALTWVVLAWAMPAFLPVFASMGVALPLPTRVLMLVVEVAKSPWTLGVGVLAGVALATRGRQWLATPRGRAIVDHVALTLPMTRPMVQKMVLARVARALASMMRSGVPAAEALLHAAHTCDSSVYSDDLLSARGTLREGLSLSEHCLRRPDLYPPLFTHALSAGDRTGRLDDLMLRMAASFELDVNHAADMLVSLLEPVIMAFLAVVVGFIMLALFLPLHGFLANL